MEWAVVQSWDVKQLSVKFHLAGEWVLNLRPQVIHDIMEVSLKQWFSLIRIFLIINTFGLICWYVQMVHDSKNYEISVPYSILAFDKS